jgi:hypothetical protein
MSQDPIQALIAQFSRFAVENNISQKDWEMAASEFGVHSTATNIERFYRSWGFGDDDQQVTATRFLRTVADDDEEIAIGIMKRVYAMADPDPDVFDQYPALEALTEDNRKIPPFSVNSKSFLDLNNVPGTFYPELVENIDRCYRLGIYDATLVLTRKLFENLLIDILRDQYGKQKIDTFYLPANKRFQNFDTLINNFENNLDDFQHLSGGLDDDFLEELDAFRQDANAEAHSIETNITEDQIEKYRKQAQHASKVLFRVRSNV